MQFRKAGSSTCSTVKTVNTDGSGNARATVTAPADGYWRYYFAGATTTPAAKATGDFVDVKEREPRPRSHRAFHQEAAYGIRCPVLAGPR